MPHQVLLPVSSSTNCFLLLIPSVITSCGLLTTESATGGALGEGDVHLSAYDYRLALCVCWQLVSPVPAPEAAVGQASRCDGDGTMCCRQSGQRTHGYRTHRAFSPHEPMLVPSASWTIILLGYNNSGASLTPLLCKVLQYARSLEKTVLQ